MRLITPFLALITLLAPTPSLADIQLAPAKVGKVLIVCIPDVNCAQAILTVRAVSEALKKDFNLRLDIVSIVYSREEMSGEYPERVVKWQIATERARARFKPDATLVFTRPYPSVGPVDFEEESTFGIVNAIGSFGSQDSLALIKVVDSPLLTFRVAIHEIGHLLGAWHTPGIGYMAGNLHSVQHADDFSAESKKQIQGHIEKLP